MSEEIVLYHEGVSVLCLDHNVPWNVSNQVEESALSSSLHEYGTGASGSGNESTKSLLDVEDENFLEKGKSRNMYIVITIFVLLVPILAARLFHKRLGHLQTES